ncbi:HIT family hydrolase [Mycolicibacterium conceptionense]|jgi:histidine triad (HIT) family protein|uniref:HIT family hydrolase n=2 Tax=Mycolicibacterium TaxID=1866885 RepID=A0ABR5G2E3_9MYCO|nr:MULTISPECIES: HIT family protein [Mycolicibacterium]KLI04389.1 HIT family hydrolase [Mycolicibacterium senegalense]KLO54319.1 HIT family hydrolase [Mycolicibacterium senegalense]KMV16831.1 HIT family hydrolase [Mycolicibacterium conceptionense]OBK02639.1 HIT family hydrolase [Mycolicibacterium conceptionense]OMB90661.1 HIT family hydrolase [Mycolicibacterium conceptionense]
MSCVFCAIVAGEAPAIRIYEDDDYLGILDIRPFTRGHTLVIPKRHSVDLTDTPAETVAAMARIGQRIARAARRSGLHADGNNIVINDGKAAFQSVFHIHLHVVPRRAGDKLSFAKGVFLRRDPDREESGRLLRAALAQLDESAQD